MEQSPTGKQEPCREETPLLCKADVAYEAQGRGGKSSPLVLSSATPVVSSHHVLSKARLCTLAALLHVAVLC